MARDKYLAEEIPRKGRKFVVDNEYPYLFDEKLGNVCMHTFYAVKRESDEGAIPEFWIALFRSDLTGTIRVFGYC